MVTICIRNTVKRPFILPFLKKAARIEAAGTRFDTIKFKLSDIDNTRKRPVESELQLLQEHGCEIYLDTDLKRLVPAAKPVEAYEESTAEPEKPAKLNTNLAKVFGTGDQVNRTIFQGDPSTSVVGSLVADNRPEQVTIGREVGMSNTPGAKSENFGQIPFDLDIMKQAMADRAKAKTEGTDVPKAKRGRSKADVKPDTAEAVAAPVETTTVVEV